MTPASSSLAGKGDIFAGLGLRLFARRRHELQLSKRDHVHVNPEAAAFAALPLAPGGKEFVNIALIVPHIRDEARPGEVTLREVLLREWEIVQTAKEGVGNAWPLVEHPRPVNPKPDDEQRHWLNARSSSWTRPDRSADGKCSN